jgi:Calcineurin-like phosphoesterase
VRRRAAIAIALAAACTSLLVAGGAAGDHPKQSSDPYAAIRGSLPPIPATIAKTDVPAIPKAEAERPWPPIPDGGVLFVHYGEEHWNDLDGLRILPQVVADSAAYQPDVVTMSGDKANDGTADQLLGWKELMKVYDSEGIPYFASPGNHDRKAHPGFPAGVDPLGELTNYFGIFADRPYPFGDAPPIDDPQFSPGARPASDPPGASTHYAFEYGPVRWVFLDNGCFSFVNCDPLQNPGFPDAEANQGQLDFLAREAGKADAAGDLLFVVMHMPTQDDRPGHVEPTPFAHTMGEGSSPENASFETAAAQLGVDGVFAAHVKGQWEYSAQGVPYYTDGGAGGEVYVGPAEDTGVDSGYWHGFRLIHVRQGEVTTDTVPVFAAAGSASAVRARSPGAPAANSPRPRRSPPSRGRRSPISSCASPTARPPTETRCRPRRTSGRAATPSS